MSVNRLADMTISSRNNFENLFSIATVLCVCIIIGSLGSLAKQYPPKFVLLDKLKKQTKVEGYKRPDSQASSQTPGAKTPDDRTMINLLENLSPEDRQLLQQRFDQAASLLHAGQFAYAITALDQVIKIQPRLPEAYVNLGYAYLGLKEYQTSAGAFSRAIDLRAEQINAYYGLAEALEGMEDYEGALGAMRSYVHLSPPDDPYVSKARAAIWEWETKLGRKPSVENMDKAIQFDPDRFASPHGPQGSPH